MRNEEQGMREEGRGKGERENRGERREKWKKK